MADRFKCPRCGSDDDFVENVTIHAWITVDIYEDGVVDEGELDHQSDIASSEGYQCLSCTHMFNKDEFSPTKRIEQAQEELARLAAGEEI